MKFELTFYVRQLVRTWPRWVLSDSIERTALLSVLWLRTRAAKAWIQEEEHNCSLEMGFPVAAEEGTDIRC